MSETRDFVSGVHIFPIKSLQTATVNGEQPRSLETGPAGFRVGDIWDRDFVIYDPNEGNIVTQRGWGKGSQKEKFPNDKRLAAVVTDINTDYLEVSVPGIGRLELAAEPSDGQPMPVNVFDNEFPAIDQGEDAADFFSKVLGRSVRLVRADREHQRVLPEEYRREGAANIVAGADGFPFLLTSQASLNFLHALKGIKSGSVPLDRFRGNIEIGGGYLGYFGEDYIDTNTEFTIGQLGVWAVKPCARCPIPNIDQKIGELAEVKATPILANRVGKRRGGEKTNMFFGQNLVHRWEDGQSVSIGDQVTIDSLSEEPSVILRNP